MARELMVGCGRCRYKRMGVQGGDKWSNLLTLDSNPKHRPDVVWNLENLPLPFPDDSFDEIHAYHVLEHCGRQGDAAFFFAQFAEFWRLLKPGGYFFGIVPSMGSLWLWGDPSHTRAIAPAALVFLSQDGYRQVGTTQMSDFRDIYHADLATMEANDNGDEFRFILQAKKG